MIFIIEDTYFDSNFLKRLVYLCRCCN